MGKYKIVTLLTLAATMFGSAPASASENVSLFKIQVSGHPREGLWYGHHDGRVGWWEIEHNRWHAHEERESFRHRPRWARR